MTDSPASDNSKPRGIEQLMERSINFDVDPSPMNGRLGKWWWFFAAAAFLSAMSLWLIFAHGAMSTVERQVTPAGTGSNSEHRQQLMSFETRLARVLSASVESKLRTLERSVERGPLTAEELRLIEATANELRLLQSNPGALAASAVSLDVKEHPRYQAVAAARPDTHANELLHHIAKLRQVYYASLIAFALLALLAAGLWFHARRRNRLIEAPMRHRLPVLNSYQQGRQR